VTPVRPTNLPVQAPTGQAGGAEAAKAAAQRAFFQAALGGAAKLAAQPAPATTTPTVFAQPVQRLPDPAAEPPTKILRPGSLLDIRV
jgi:hypothetical protein